METQYDIFMSYRRKGGGDTAGRIRDRLVRDHKYRVFYDVEDMYSGPFNTQLYGVIEQCRYFIVILSPKSLDRCQNPGDFFRLEIAHALKQKKVIIPVMVRDFVMPSADELPPEIANLVYCSALTIHPGFFDPFMERLCSYLANRPVRPKARRRFGRITFLLVAFFLLCIGGFFGVDYLRSEMSAISAPYSSQALRKCAAQKPKSPEGERDATVPTVGELRSFADIEMVWCPRGEFLMGSGMEPSEVAKRYGGDAQFYDDTRPVHPVKLAEGFWLGKCEVTNAEFEAFVTATAYLTEAERLGSGFGLNKATGKWEDTKSLTWRNPGGWKPSPRDPVVMVSWNDAQAYIGWLNHRLGGVGFRLPSEAEWEYACRAGSKSEFFWGDEADAGQGYLNAAGLEGAPNGETWPDRFNFNDKYTGVAPVGTFKPNAWGLYDMHGNVWEWCQDCYQINYDGAPSDGSAWEVPASRFRGLMNKVYGVVHSAWQTPEGGFRVLRGGSFRRPPGGCRAACRAIDPPDNRACSRGFRLARTPQEDGV